MPETTDEKGSTSPHDYRALFESVPDLTVVGGQAVNVWAVVYCDPETDELPTYGSYDLDVLARGEVAKAIAKLPNWNYEKTPLWKMDVRSGALFSKTPDGRLLVVEILKKVNGLDEHDLKATQPVTQGGVTLRVLDPIAMLKSKAINLVTLKQDGSPPRQDLAHLKIVAICFPRFLIDAHEQGAAIPSGHDHVFSVVRRAFALLSTNAIATTLMRNGIVPSSLMPPLQDSPIEKVRTAYRHQLPRLKELESRLG